MKNLLLFCCVALLSCNTVKKAKTKNLERRDSAAAVIKHKHGLSSDIMALNHASFKKLNKSLQVSFFPETTALLARPIFIKDSAGITSIDMGDYRPAAINYTNEAAENSIKDFSRAVYDSIEATERSKIKTSAEQALVTTDKHTSRLSLVLVIGGILLFMFFGWLIFKIKR